MRGGITLYAVGKIPPLPSCLAPPECCRSVPFCVPDDPQSHINKGGGSSIRGCYAWYMHEMRVTARNAKWPCSFFVLLIVFAFREAADTYSLLVVFLQQTWPENMQQIRRQIMHQTCIKPTAKPAANLQQTCSKSCIRLHHTNKVHHSICLAHPLARVLISIHFVLVYPHDILQLPRN